MIESKPLLTPTDTYSIPLGSPKETKRTILANKMISKNKNGLKTEQFTLERTTKYRLIKAGHDGPIKRVYKREDALETHTCGEVHHVNACPTYAKGHTKEYIPTSCHRIRCKVCKEYAVNRQVARTLPKHDALDKLLKENHNYKLPDSHVVISFKDGYIKKRQIMDKGLASVWRKLKYILTKYNIGILGCTAVFHAYRTDHSDGTNCEDVKNCKLSHIETFSPHFHLLGKIYLEDSETVYNKTKGKVLIKKIPDKRERNLLATLQYELGHTTTVVNIETNRSSQAVHYYGLMSRSVMHRELTETNMIPIKCEHPECKNNIMAWQNRSETLKQEMQTKLKHFISDRPDVGQIIGPVVQRDDVWKFWFDDHKDRAVIIHSYKILENQTINPLPKELRK